MGGRFLGASSDIGGVPTHVYMYVHTFTCIHVHV